MNQSSYEASNNVDISRSSDSYMSLDKQTKILNGGRSERQHQSPGGNEMGNRKYDGKPYIIRFTGRTEGFDSDE